MKLSKSIKMVGILLKVDNSNQSRCFTLSHGVKVSDFAIMGK